MSAGINPSLLPKSEPTLPDDPGSNAKEKPVLKRNACEVCRKRKLRCDGETPSCGRCSRLGHDCAYNDNRRKSGPRRGYVKGLEARLAQVEGLLSKQEGFDQFGTDISHDRSRVSNNNDVAADGFDVTLIETEFLEEGQNVVPDTSPGQAQAHFDFFPQFAEDDVPDLNLPNDGFSWAMIELGVDEPLPPQGTIDELNELYFAKVHPQVPIIHQYRFLAAMSLAPYARPSAAVRYAMWTLAASVSEKYKHFHTVFYARARKYAEADEMTGRYRYINVRHAQAWILIGIYEFKMMHFPHAWLTTGRATRLTQMMNLNRLDGLGLDVKQSLPVPLDWSEKEERRRTFWMAFCMDRYASIGTGWPMIVDERDIMTNLPSSDEAFAENFDEEVSGMSLSEAMNPSNASRLSAFAGVAIIASLTGRNLQHLQRPSPSNDDHDLNGEFWKQHRHMDNILLNTSLCLPSHLRLPAGLPNPNKIFLNMSLQSGTISLHQAAIFKAETLKLPASIITESRMRCLAAATEICSIMKMVAHMDLSMLNVYTPFPLYVSARIFAQVSKSDPEDDNARSSVRFLLSALVALKEVIPLAESYLIQLDIEGSGLAALQDNVRWFSGLEKGVAELSVKEELNDESWITFVSPLVRIVERKDDSLSPPSISSGGQQTSNKSSLSASLFVGSSSATVSSGSGNHFELPTDLSAQSHNMGSLPSREHWEENELDGQQDIFGSLMDMETQNWE